MKISALNEIASDFSVEELKRNLSRSFEPKDTLKFAEFDPQYKDWPGGMISNLRVSNINNPNVHYLGEFNQGNYELTSPRFFCWRYVQMYVQSDNTNSILYLELKYFKLIMIPLIILFFASILISLYAPPSGLMMLIGTSLVLGLMIFKARNTVNYFEKYTTP